ncbi:hypothetical protein AWB78_00663 [Caballeronia calidae]|uniref:Uncharacterized protein n=1 Tax=Caballeronia calidae TaxID=1777139 RepID=A0A157ZKD6_9BURK|nr:hypothetical protein AWB78_00663 [Caballeronia calidae]
MSDDVGESPAALIADAPPSAVPGVHGMHEPGFVFLMLPSTHSFARSMCRLRLRRRRARTVTFCSSRRATSSGCRARRCARRKRSFPSPMAGICRNGFRDTTESGAGVSAGDHRVIWFALMVRKANGAEWSLLTRLSRAGVVERATGCPADRRCSGSWPRVLIQRGRSPARRCPHSIGFRTVSALGKAGSLTSAASLHGRTDIAL